MEEKKEKILCVLLDDDVNYFKWNKKEPFIQPELNEAYARFTDIGKNYMVKVIFTRWTNYKNNLISRYWHFDEKWKRFSEKIKPDLFYDKFILDKKSIVLKKKLSNKKILFNSLDLELFCKDKFVQSQEFKSMSPKSFKVSSNKQLIESMEKITTKKAILKPLFGHGGFGIKIYEKNSNLSKTKFTTPYILQELLDTTKGVPDLKIKGVHDIRCVTINGKIAYTYVRVPKKGLLANLHQGGRAINVIPPKKIVGLVSKIDKYMKRFGDRVYSADFFFANNKYYLVELNSKPGFDACGKYGFAKEENKFFDLFFKQILVKKMK